MARTVGYERQRNVGEISRGERFAAWREIRARDRRLKTAAASFPPVTG